MDGPEEWIGTTVDWDLRQDGDWTIVLFKHEGWREPVEFMHHCSTKWATFLISLKQLVETGEGAPDPRDRDDQRLALSGANRLDHSCENPQSRPRMIGHSDASVRL